MRLSSLVARGQAVRRSERLHPAPQRGGQVRDEAQRGVQQDSRQGKAERGRGRVVVSRASRAREAAGREAAGESCLHEDVLPNGLRVFVVPRKGVNRAVVNMLFRVGSRFETRENERHLALPRAHALPRTAIARDRARSGARVREPRRLRCTRRRRWTTAHDLALPPDSLDTRFAAVWRGGGGTAFFRHRDRARVSSARRSSRTSTTRAARSTPTTSRAQLIYAAPARLHHHRRRWRARLDSTARCSARTTRGTTRGEQRRARASRERSIADAASRCQKHFARLARGRARHRRCAARAQKKPRARASSRTCRARPSCAIASAPCRAAIRASPRWRC